MVYIIANANVTSGGPELLHQFCSELVKIDVEASMVYFDKLKFPTKSISDVVKKNYGKYHCPVSYVIKDSSDNVVVFSETVLWLLPRFSKVKKVIWWLSVDNYYTSFFSKYAKVYAPLGMKRKKFDPFVQNIIHCYQSEYAKRFLEKNNVMNALSLSDYLSEEFIKASRDEKICKKENIVLYNPRKGLDFTQKLINVYSEIQWVPLQNLTHSEMCELMKHSKVYIDFGNHPGKDRIPREAAMCGCCIITGLRGSAENSVDIPIGDQFKKNDEEENVIEIVNLIRKCIINYDAMRVYFDNYRSVITKEYEVFCEEIKHFMRVAGIGQ